LRDKHQVKRCDPSRFAQCLPAILFNFVYGLESDIPLCCVIEYCFRYHVLGQLVAAYVHKLGHTYDAEFAPCVIHRAMWIRPYRKGEIRPSNRP
jgi:hypothetical protein